MSWISSKLKAAETLLQQIDQQAAESLRKNERPRSDELKLDTSTKSSGVVSLKDQLKKKTQENNDFRGKLQSDTNANSGHGNNSYAKTQNVEKEIPSSPSPSPKPKATTLTDSDWTELLGTPGQGTSSSGKRNNGVSTIRGLRKDVKRQGSFGANSPVLEGKRNQKSNNNVVRSARRPDITSGTKLIGKPGESEESSSSGRPSSVDLQNDGKNLGGLAFDQDSSMKVTAEIKDAIDEENSRSNFKDISSEGPLQSLNKNRSLEKLEILGKVAGASDGKMEVVEARNKLRSTLKEKTKSDVAVSDDLKRSSSAISDESSDSETDSGSSSDSESEREREERRRRREKLLAERAAAKAVEAIKERENFVAKMEGEKESLEKILEERAKQQAQEASELQTTMMEMMEAAEQEKQKHNYTRMEAFQRLAKLESANADLARSLATVQKKLELEINQVAEIRQQIEVKEVAHEELRRQISSSHQPQNYSSQLAASKGIEFEREILEAEYSLIDDKIGQLQQKAKQLEANIELTRKDMEEPTEVEIELKRRLGQLTDHLIQKQAQVEALSSEKATLMFRTETVSGMLDESKSANIDSGLQRDVESGTWNLSDSKFNPSFQDKIRSGKKQLGSLLQQLDAIFSAGAVFLRRNPTAKMWSLVYLLCLHFWVLYILMSHSGPSNETRSGAVISLQNINNTSGV